jgi:hypothetical protein
MSPVQEFPANGEYQVSMLSHLHSVLPALGTEYFYPHSWSWALLEKLPIVRLLENFPAFYGTRRFITAFTWALHRSLSWARSIQSQPSHSTSLRWIFLPLFLTYMHAEKKSGCPTRISTCTGSIYIGIRNHFSGFKTAIAVRLVVTLFIFYALCHYMSFMYCGGTPGRGVSVNSAASPLTPSFP